MFDLSQPHPDRCPELVRATTRARHHDERLAGEAGGGRDLRGERRAAHGVYVFWATMHGLSSCCTTAGKLPAKPDFQGHSRKGGDAAPRPQGRPRRWRVAQRRRRRARRYRLSHADGELSAMSILLSLSPFAVFFVLMRLHSADGRSHRRARRLPLLLCARMRWRGRRPRSAESQPRPLPGAERLRGWQRRRGRWPPSGSPSCPVSSPSSSSRSPSANRFTLQYARERAPGRSGPCRSS